MEKQNFGFEWIPSGMDEGNEFPVEMGFVKSKIKKYYNHRREQVVDGYLAVELYDRIIVVNLNPKNRRLRSSFKNLDGYCYLDWQNERSKKNPIMLSSYYSMDQETLDFRERIHSDVWADSGGYQCASGVVSYLDPEEIMKHYNREASIGLTLDVPLSLADYGRMRNLTALALAQRRWIEVMIKVKSPSVKLLNIVHGWDEKSLRKYICIVKRKECSGWAVGGLGLQKKILAVAILYHEHNSRWVHILGVGSASMIPTMLYLSKFLRISCDSSSHLEGGRRRKYLKIERNGKMRSDVYIGRNYDFTKLDEKTLPCKCKVCQTVSSPNFFRGENIANTAISNMLMNHNLYTIRKYIDFWQAKFDLLKDNFGAYLNEVRSIAGAEAGKYLVYSHTAMTLGIEQAERLPKFGRQLKFEEDFDWGYSSISNLLNYEDLVRDESFLNQLAPNIRKYLITHRRDLRSPA